MIPQPKTAFVMESPYLEGGNRPVFTLHTADRRLIEVVKNYPGITRTDDLDVIQMLHAFIDRNFDYEEVWIMLYDELVATAKFNETWADALEGI